MICYCFLIVLFSPLKVGALKFRDYDAHVISTNGGIIVEVDGASDFKNEIVQLLEMLRKKEIDGILVDKYTMWLITDVFNTWSYNKTHSLISVVNFFLNHTIRTQVYNEGRKLSYGILVKSYDDYIYFHDIITEWELNFHTQYSLSWNIRQASFRHHSTQLGLFSANEQYFQDTLAYMVIIIGVIWVFGIFYEIIRRQRDYKSKYRMAQNVVE